jgi:methanethiol S-methyltransferase
MPIPQPRASSTISSSLARTTSELYAWGAALIFGLSLGVGVWRYVALGRTLPPDGLPPPALAVSINILLFGLFALHHSIMAREPMKAWVARLVPPHLERATYVWVASLLFLLVCIAWQPVPGTWYRATGAVALALTIAQVLGLALTADAASRITPRQLAGLDQAHAAVSPVTTRRDIPPEPLVAGGGYALVRHPIYLGWILMVWCTPHMSMGRLTFAAVSTAYLLLAIPLEERSLARRLGVRYQEYAARVRWRVIPGLY